MARRLAPILAVLIGTAAAASGGSVVYLHPAAVVQTGTLTLGAIAVVLSGDPREAAELTALPLGPAPARPCFLTPQEVRRRVEGAWAGRLDLVGSGVALLPAGAVPAPQQAQAAALLAALGREGQGRLEVDLLSPLPESAGKPVLLSRTGGSERLAGRIQVQIGEASVLVFVHPYASVARAARDLPRDHLLSGEDVQYAEEDLSSLQGSYLTPADLEGSFRTLAPVSRGALLEPARLTRNLLVRAGERVTVVFVRPGLSVTLSGKAWGSGGRGETVEVTLRDPTRRFRGRVTDTGEVVVEQR